MAKGALYLRKTYYKPFPAFPTTKVEAKNKCAVRTDRSIIVLSTSTDVTPAADIETDNSKKHKENEWSFVTVK